MSIVEVKVPDIGDFKEVEVIELMVKPGDTVKVDQSLVTVESTRPAWKSRPAMPAWSRNCASRWATRSLKDRYC